MRGTVREVGIGLAASVLWMGCATLREPPPEPAEAPAGAEVRPQAPPEYDVLVAQQHAREGRAEEALEAYRRAAAKDDDSAFLHRKVAAGLAQTNRLDEAFVHAERAYELEPDDPSTRIFLAQLYRIRRDTAAAEAVLRAADGEPVSEDAALLLYQIYLETGRLPQALAMGEWLVDSEPDALRGRVALANVYQRMEQPLEAERMLRDALDRDPGNLRIYGALARSLRERGDAPGEIELYDEVLELYPHHHPTLVALGEAQMASDDLEGAIVTFETITEQWPDDVQSVKNLGYLEFEARNFERAEQLFERAVAANPDEVEAAFFLGVVRRRIGDGDGAIAAFERVPPDHPHHGEARTQLAAVYERRGQYELALAEVERAAKLNPDRTLDLYAAVLRAKAGDFDGAVTLLERLIDQEPSDDELLFNMGVIYGEAKRTGEAIEFMQRALEVNPDNASALNYIGYTWAEQGTRLDEAERMISRAIELRPDDGFIVDSLGWVYYMRARPLVESGRATQARPLIERALEELTRADELTGGDPVISEHLGDTYLLLDEKHRALEKFQEAIRLEPREGEQPHLLEKFENLRRELR
jgi:tetratricopeptide (TPR) repeat protein